MAKIRDKPRPVITDRPSNTVPNPGWFKNGGIPNPNGRPIGARSRFNEAFALDMQRLWADPKYGGMVLLKRVSRRNPEAILRVAVALAPKQVSLDVEQAVYIISDKPISADDWAAKYADPEPVTIEARPVDEKVH
jgi:hypothetical protein